MEEEVVFRKFDSEDIIRLRSKSLVTSIVRIDDREKEHVSVDSGLLQKSSIILGIKKCPWFSNIIDDEKGMDDVIFNKRWNLEFRKIPIIELDKLFKQTQEFNKIDYNIDELKKK